MSDLYICNIDTGKEVRSFKDVTDFKEGFIDGSILIATEGNNYLVKLRECDFIEILNK